MKTYELLAHTADFKIRAYGKDLKELFKNCLRGMFESLKPHSPNCKYVDDEMTCNKMDVSHEVEVTATELPFLLVQFLQEALYLSDVNNEAYFDAKFDELTDTALKGKIFGVKITGFEVIEIKAVTYNDLEVKKVDDTWQATVVFDI
ncbi:archease [Candidatus Dependentiae bacterium]|nr:archease [Candidatus Dependentiae bacterium]